MRSATFVHVQTWRATREMDNSDSNSMALIVMSFFCAVAQRCRCWEFFQRMARRAVDVILGTCRHVSSSLTAATRGQHQHTTHPLTAPAIACFSPSRFTQRSRYLRPEEEGAHAAKLPLAIVSLGDARRRRRCAHALGKPYKPNY